MRQELKAPNDAAASIVYGQKRIAWTSTIVRTAGCPTRRRAASRQLSDIRIGQALARRIVPIMSRSNSQARLGLEYARRQSQIVDRHPRCMYEDALVALPSRDSARHDLTEVVVEPIRRQLAGVDEPVE